MFDLVKKVICWLFMMILCSTAFADIASDYKESQQYIQESKIQNELEKVVVNPNIGIEIKKNPDEEKYFNEQDTMDSETHSTPGVYTAIKDIAQNTNAVKINKESEEAKYIEKIESNADDIVSGTYKDCNKEDVIEKGSYLTTCETTHTYNVNCIKVLKTEKKKRLDKVIQKYTFSDYEARSKNGLSIQLPSITGTIRSVHLAIKSIIYKSYCQHNYILQINNQNAVLYDRLCDEKSDYIRFDKENMSINFTDPVLTLNVKGLGILGTLNGYIEFEYSKEAEEIESEWQSTCDVSDSSCPIISSQCLEKNIVKSIKESQITNKCRKISEIHQCGNEDKNNCSLLQSKSCSQISTQCITFEKGRCSHYKDTWSCPNNHIVGHKLICGENVYCADGSCQQLNHEENKEAGKALSDLSAAQQVGSEFQNNPNSISSIFAGDSGFCSIDALNVVDCCKNNGWGKDLLAKCTEREKELAEAKGKGLAVYIGKYCHNKDAGVCLEYRKVYCIFKNKIAFDVQTQGRKKQLGKSFGSSESPDCSGLSVNEISKINFDRIDFRNIENDIRKKIEIPVQNAQLNATEKVYRSSYEHKN